MADSVMGSDGEFTVLGLPVGGAPLQVLRKVSGDDYDTEWADPVGGLTYRGTWNASTNSPSLASGVGTNGDYYQVSAAGTTSINGIADWGVGDFIIFNGTAWQKIDNSNDELVSLLRGGTGRNNGVTVYSATGAVHNYTPPTSVIVITSASTVSFSGMTAGAFGRIRFVNISATAHQFLHDNTGSLAANRFRNRGNTTFILQPGCYLDYDYDNVSTSRWLLSADKITASSPLGIDTNGNFTILPSGSFQTGSASSAQVNNWDGKVAGSFSGGTSIPYVAANSGPPTLASNGSDLSYNPTLKQLGIQVDAASSQASLHAASLIPQTVADPSALNLQPYTFTPPNPPSSASFSQVQPDVQRAAASAVAANSGSGNYSSSSIVDYLVTTVGYDTGLGAEVSCVTTQQITGITDSSGFDINYDMLATSPAQNFATTKWIIQRQIDSGGYNDYMEIPVGSPTGVDNNTGWTPGPPSLPPAADDFLANGTNRTINVYGTVISPISSTIVSATAYGTSFMDNGSQEAYKLQFDIVGGDNGDGYNIDFNGDGHEAAGSSNTFSPSDFAGAPIITPNSYGYLANGSNSMTWDFYSISTIAGQSVYSVNPASNSWNDPNDYNYYWFELLGTPAAGKLIKTSNSTAIITSGTVVDDGVTSFSASTSVFPNSFTPPALKTEGDNILGRTSDKVGLFGSSGATRATITGSRGGNAALANLLTYLQNRGDIINSTT